MQNPMPKLRQRSFIPKKPAFMSEKLKTWRAPTAIEFNIFYWNFVHIFYLIMSTKGCSEFFLFRSWVINKNVKKQVCRNQAFLIFANNSRSKQNKKNPAHPFVDIGM